jgi:hypothetical protein
VLQAEEYPMHIVNLHDEPPMKIFNAIFAVLCVVSAGLQYNDPDPWLWAPIYLYTAVLCVMAVRGKYNEWLYLAGLGFYSAYAILLLVTPGGVISWAKDHHAESLVQEMKAAKPWIEATREFFGLLILIAMLLANRAWLRKKVPGNPA